MLDKVFLQENEVGKYYFLGIDFSNGEDKAIIFIERNKDNDHYATNTSTYKLIIRRSTTSVYVVSYGRRINIIKGLNEITKAYPFKETCKTQKVVVKCICGGNIKSTQKDIMLMESEYTNAKGEAVGEITYKQVGQPIDPHYVCGRCGTTYHKHDLKTMKRERVLIDDRNTCRTQQSSSGEL